MSIVLFYQRLSCPHFNMLTMRLRLQIEDIRGNSKTSTSTEHVNDISRELIIHWNSPVVCKRDSEVRQALNVHFKGGIAL